MLFDLWMFCTISMVKYYLGDLMKGITYCGVVWIIGYTLDYVYVADKLVMFLLFETLAIVLLWQFVTQMMLRCTSKTKTQQINKLEKDIKFIDAMTSVIHWADNVYTKCRIENLIELDKIVRGVDDSESMSSSELCESESENNDNPVYDEPEVESCSVNNNPVNDEPEVESCSVNNDES
jgi:hypothetical protein